jgi:hypothetical protein
MNIVLLKEKLGQISDPWWQRRNLWHKLEDIFVIGLTALLYNREDFDDMETFGQEREAEPRRFLEPPKGIPDASIFFRVFKRVKPEELSACLYARPVEARELEE